MRRQHAISGLWLVCPQYSLCVWLYRGMALISQKEHQRVTRSAVFFFISRGEHQSMRVHEMNVSYFASWKRISWPIFAYLTPCSCNLFWNLFISDVRSCKLLGIWFLSVYTKYSQFHFFLPVTLCWVNGLSTLLFWLLFVLLGKNRVSI